MELFTCCSHPFFKGKRRYFLLPKGDPSTNSTIKKIIMRIHIATFLILISCLNVFSKASAQKISLQFKQVELETVFKAIERQTDYGFAYGVALLANSAPVTVLLKDVSLVEALDHIFAGLPYRYEIVNKTILIKGKGQVTRHTASENTKPIRITGKVTDIKNNTLIGVSVRLRGTNIGTITDRNGNYQIVGEPDGTLVYSFVGFKTMQIEVNGQAEVNLTLIELTSKLEETVIKGYYNTTKIRNTGNVSTVKAEDIARQPIGDPIAALIGRVPGLFIQPVDGTPGRELTIRLRGQNSLANGNNPLFIIDGIQFNSNSFTLIGATGIATAPVGGPISPFSFLNPSDIESIEIFKDADATAIYGSRGANGVILITTKKGKAGKTQFDVNFYTGGSKAPQRVKFMNTQEYLSMRRQAFANDGKSPGLNDYDLNGKWDTTSYTNWQDYFVGGTGKLTEASVSVSGGNDFTNFRIGSTLRNEGTIYPGEFLTKKISLQFGLNHSSTNKKFNASLMGAYVYNVNNLPSGVFEATTSFRLAPNLPKPFKEDGSLNWAPNSEWVNPMSAFLQTSDEKANNLVSNLLLSYRPINNLEIRSSFGYNATDFSQSNLTPFIAYNPSLSEFASLLRSNEFLDNRLKSWVIEPQISYQGKVLGGRFEMLVGTTFQSTVKNYLAMSARGFTTDALIENFAAGPTVTTKGRSNTVYRYSAIYSRIGYSFHDRYILNVTARRDGSSRFGPENKFGNFGAIGAAWVFSNEAFFKGSLPFVSLGKIRSSFGSTGNDQLTDYQYLDTYSTNTSFYQGVSSLIPTQLTNPYYGWERVNKIEIGLELGFMDNKLLLNTSVYRNKTSNQLVQYGLPSVAGFTSIRANLPAVLENSGLEIDLHSDNFNSKVFSWSTNVNITFPTNKLVSYPNIEASSYATRYAIGQPLSLLRLYHYTGRDPVTGLFTFEDFNKDGNLTTAFDNQFYFVGQKFYGGIQNNFGYKGFELDFLFQFTKQNGRAFFKSIIPPGFFNSGNGNQPNYLLGSEYQLPFSQSKALISTSNNIFNSSDGLLSDASFMRLKNLSLSWRMPLNYSIRSILKSVRLYAQGQNLLTFTKYVGFDPEAPSDAVRLPSLKTLTIGLQVTL
ncbi:SusC/RagA family TonB-linked outer membrane protein [Chitinophaga sp. SYP-B3965]|uniref:SusC/RagA family TonB-linked outer membrane protein n=1 Tax=Chitinophaga sp. SYP-B3965 TaxID=2663120 RepID=UPI00129973BE|nr:SusC/RagA family TonB-linked outer membrane protein [Chitinophaga sp. SYP-B3965]MRG44856.1 SusC/RagA family TonB-linked outer membrane protein [Chitinophaga sp. SYP-B3965]